MPPVIDGRPRSLPVLPRAPQASPGLRQLPLAAEARDAGPRLASDLRGLGADAQVRPGLPSLRFAGRPDAARRAHDRRVPRPGSPDGGPRRAGGDGHRRRGLPARRLARDRACHPARGHAVLDDHRRPGHDGGARARRRRAGCRARASRSTGARRPTTGCAAWSGAYRAALAAAAHLRAAGITSR